MTRPGLFYVRALALMTLLLAAGASVWTAGAAMGLPGWEYASLLWCLAAVYGALSVVAARGYRRSQYDLRAQQRRSCGLAEALPPRPSPARGLPRLEVAS